MIFKDSFDNKSVLRIKKIESTTNHDVKAVEYYIRDYFIKDKVLKTYTHLIHFGLTSEDINSLSYAYMIKNGISIFVDELNKVNKSLKRNSNRCAKQAFLARTHGQASLTFNIRKRV